MRFTAPAPALGAALARATAIIETRQIIPILGSVKVVADRGALRVSATNHDIYIDALVEGATIDEPGEACIPAAEFARLVGLARKVAVEVATEDRTATLRFGRTAAELVTFDPEEFPRAPDWAAMAMQDVDGALLARALRFGAVAMADSDLLYYLKGVHVRAADGGAEITATEKGLLHRATMPAMPMPGEAILPDKHLPTIIGVAEADGRTLFGLGETWWAIEGDSVRARGSVVDGKFPDANRIVNAPAELVAVTDREALREAIDVATTGAQRAGKIVHVVLDIAGDEIGVRGFKPGSALAKGVATSIDAETRAPLRATYNAQYLQDTLKLIGCDRVALFDAGNSILHVEPAEQAIEVRFRAVVSAVLALAEEMAAA